MPRSRSCRQEYAKEDARRLRHTHKFHQFLPMIHEIKATKDAAHHQPAVKAHTSRFSPVTYLPPRQSTSNVKTLKSRPPTRLCSQWSLHRGSALWRLRNRCQSYEGKGGSSCKKVVSGYVPAVVLHKSAEPTTVPPLAVVHLPSWPYPSNPCLRGKAHPPAYTLATTP